MVLVIPVTLDPISSLETELLTRFDKVGNELLISKHHYKNLQEENERFRKRVSFLDNKVNSFGKKKKN